MVGQAELAGTTTTTVQQQAVLAAELQLECPVGPPALPAKAVQAAALWSDTLSRRGYLSMSLSSVPHASGKDDN